MSTEMSRIMLLLPKDIVEQAEVIKKDDFYNKSYAEMYRQLIRLGLTVAKRKSPQ